MLHWRLAALVSVLTARGLCHKGTVRKLRHQIFHSTKSFSKLTLLGTDFGFLVLISFFMFVNKVWIFFFISYKSHRSFTTAIVLKYLNSLSINTFLEEFAQSWVRSHAPSIQSHRGTIVVLPDFQPMRVPAEPVCIDLFRQNPVFTSLHLNSPVHVHRLWFLINESRYLKG